MRHSPTALSEGLEAIFRGADEVDGEAATLYLAELANHHMAWLKAQLKQR